MMRLHNVEQLVVVTVLSIVAALSLPAYGRITTHLHARGVELAWYHQTALLLLVVFASFLILMVIGLGMALTAQVIEKAGRVYRGDRG